VGVRAACGLRRVMDVTRIMQMRGPAGSLENFDAIDAQTMAVVSRVYVDWHSATLDVFPPTPVTQPLDPSTYRVYGVSNEPLRYSLAGTPPAWLAIDPIGGTMSGTPTAQGTFSFGVVARGTKSGDTAQKTIAVPASDLRIAWADGITDLRGSYTTAGQVAIPLDATNPSGNVVSLTIAGAAPPGVSVTPDRRLVASRRIGVTSATVRASVANRGLDAYVDRTFALLAAKFLRTTFSISSTTFEIDHPDPNKHPVEILDGLAKAQRLSTIGPSGFQGTTSIVSGGWSVLVRYRPRSAGCLLEALGSFRVDADRPVSTASWVARADSQETASGVSNVLDGSDTTRWHSQCGSVQAPLPHWIEIDMGEVRTVSGMRYVPRRSGGWNGIPYKYQILVSSDGVSFGPPVADGTMYAYEGPSQASDQGNPPFLHDPVTIPFAAVSTRVVRLVILSNITGNPSYASASTIDLVVPIVSSARLTVPKGSGIRTALTGGGSVYARAGSRWTSLAIAASASADPVVSADGRVAVGPGTFDRTEWPAPSASANVTIGYSAGSGASATAFDADISHALICDTRLSAVLLRAMCAGIAHGVLLAPSDATLLRCLDASEWGVGMPLDIAGRPAVDATDATSAVTATVEARAQPVTILALSTRPAIVDNAAAPPSTASAAFTATWTDATADLIPRWLAGGGQRAVPARAFVAVVPAGSVDVDVAVPPGRVYAFSRDLGVEWARGALDDVRPHYGADGTFERHLYIASGGLDTPPSFASDVSGAVDVDGTLKLTTHTTGASSVRVFATVWRDGVHNTLTRELALLTPASKSLFSGGNGSNFLQFRTVVGASGPEFRTDDVEAGWYFARFASASAQLDGGAYTVSDAAGITVVLRLKRSDVGG
jgi:F5/8 type C domain/Putative Ig domain